ncbi:DUF3006 domain-containing protein [Clostridium estertheticum]|uniref:DUF3006 domain-containing protein n=1 Tax=Clostridium estertheticum TaxID=238834 RepID=UPI001C7CCE3B|nr:DUF3006 domain-containing protein [Clostridium estertheticum]MBX4263264.1 DUF3006 domain-containing protein [Clostridium estertheticum]WLC89560.1 DUF3006 domain-containing protein [Clostridium estertheticum]
MDVIIDRFEGNYAVCEKEDGTMIDIKKSKIPSIAKERDVLSIDNDVIIIDIEKTKKRLNEIEKLTKGLWE